MKFFKYHENVEGNHEQMNYPDSIGGIIDVFKSLPGIELVTYYSGEGCSKISFFFRVTRPEGLFFITRCTDNRYWKYGYLWSIELSCGDEFRDNVLPTIYELHSGPVVGELAYEMCSDLIDNCLKHLNDDAFLNAYNLDINEIEHEEEPDISIEEYLGIPTETTMMANVPVFQAEFGEPEIIDDLPF